MNDLSDTQNSNNPPAADSQVSPSIGGAQTSQAVPNNVPDEIKLSDSPVATPAPVIPQAAPTLNNLTTSAPVAENISANSLASAGLTGAAIPVKEEIISPVPADKPLTLNSDAQITPPVNPTPVSPAPIAPEQSTINGNTPLQAAPKAPEEVKEVL